MSELVIRWPQIVWIALAAFSLIRTIAKFGEPKKSDTYDVGDLVAFGIVVWLLYEGGFFTGGAPS